MLFSLFLSIEERAIYPSRAPNSMPAVPSATVRPGPTARRDAGLKHHQPAQPNLISTGPNQHARGHQGRAKGHGLIGLGTLAAGQGQQHMQHARDEQQSQQGLRALPGAQGGHELEVPAGPAKLERRGLLQSAVAKPRHYWLKGAYSAPCPALVGRSRRLITLTFIGATLSEITAYT